MRSYIIILAALILSTSAYAQLKVDNTGRIGMGTNWPNPGYKCHIKGNLLLTTYPDVPFYEFQFKVGNGWPGTEIGSTADKIAFWSSYNGYNKLYAEQFYKQSDASLKTNIQPIQKPSDKIMQLKPYIYELKEDVRIPETTESLAAPAPAVKQYGFISQDVEATLKEVKITDDGKGIKLLEYDQIIPLIVASMQEQQKRIAKLEAQIAKILASGPLKPVGSVLGGINLSNACRLTSNTPNPFTSNTSIGYYLCDASTAEIKVWDMQGMLMKSFELESQKGFGNVLLQGSDLANSGTYVYALIIDGTIVDSKTLIFNK